jgi:hypothetical protein
MTDKNSPAWRQVVDAMPGQDLADWTIGEYRVLIRRGFCALCAYVGVPTDHPWAGWDRRKIPVEVHGGFTFCSVGDGDWPVGYYWFGWDYGHFMDYRVFPDLPEYDSHGHQWTVDEVRTEALAVIEQFKRLRVVAEAVQVLARDEE